MIAAVLIPGFDLRAALRLRPGLEASPAALAPLQRSAPRHGRPLMHGNPPMHGREPLLGSVTAAAQMRGIGPGIRLTEALAACPELVLVEPDPAGVERLWHEILQRLEVAGFTVEPVRPGTLYFDTSGVERLYGGLEPALRRALASVGPEWEARAGAAELRLAALAAAGVARVGQVLIVCNDRMRTFVAPLPLSLLPLERGRYEELEEIEELPTPNIGELAGLPGRAVAERLGPDGRRAWGLAREEHDEKVSSRQPVKALVETLEFSNGVDNELELRRGLALLLGRVLARPERSSRSLHRVALWARLAGGRSWRRSLTLQEPTADPARLRLALGSKLSELPAPVLKLRLEVIELAEQAGAQLELVL
jgi:protein ImuB